MDSISLESILANRVLVYIIIAVSLITIVSIVGYVVFVIVTPNGMNNSNSSVALKPRIFPQSLGRFNSKKFMKSISCRSTPIKSAEKDISIIDINPEDYKIGIDFLNTKSVLDEPLEGFAPITSPGANTDTWVQSIQKRDSLIKTAKSLAYTADT